MVSIKARPGYERQLKLEANELNGLVLVTLREVGKARVLIIRI